VADDAKARYADVVVMALLASGADRGFRSLDVFVTWFVTGTAAALGLAAANLDRLQGLVTLPGIKAALPLLLAVLGFVLASKFLGGLICTYAGAIESSMTTLDRLVKLDQLPDPLAFDAALARATPWPVRAWQWLGCRLGVNNRGRQVMWLMVVSGFCASAAAILTVLFWMVLLGYLPRIL
jgi:hypothetical protein